MADYNINGLAIPLFLGLMLVEYGILRAQGRQLHRFNDSVASLSMGLCLLISDALLKAYTLAVFIWLWQHHRWFDFQIDHPITWVLFFLGVDFCYYWFHRFAHTINLLWGAHVGHHQGEEYNFTTALRQSAFQYAFSWLFYLPLALLGCPPLVFVVQFVGLKLYQFWLHTQAIDRLPLVEGILSTPSSHRVHHAKNPRYIDRNYGGTLVIWDRCFGTWQPELTCEPCHYGTTRPLDTFNPIRANLQHWAMLWRDARRTRRWRDKFGLWLRPTGWRPADCAVGEAGTSGLQHSGCADRPKYDPQTTRATRVYVAVSMLLTFGVCVPLIFLSPQLPAPQLALGIALVLGGLVMANRLLENRTHGRWLEVLRLPCLLWYAINLWSFPITTTLVHTATLNGTAAQSLHYAASVNRWPEWHPQSTEVQVAKPGPLVSGDQFQELIATPLGAKRIHWQVGNSVPGESWRARGVDRESGITLALTYRALDLNDRQSHFERTLDYTLPNFPLVVANALHLKQSIERQSEDALGRLQRAVNTPSLNH